MTTDNLNRAKLITRFTGFALGTAKMLIANATPEQLTALDAAASAQPPGPAVVAAVDAIRAALDERRKAVVADGEQSEEAQA